MKSVLKKTIIFFSLFVMPLAHQMKASFSGLNAMTDKHIDEVLTRHRKLKQDFLLQFEQKKQEEIEKYGLIPCTDPELLQLFNTIKHDMGITDDIPLYLSTKNNDDINGSHHVILGPDLDNKRITIGIALNSKRDDYHSFLIHTIAHELGHALQYNGDHGSYQSKDACLSFVRSAPDEEIKENNIKKETSADAHAIGYQDCQHCLKHQQTILLCWDMFMASQNYLGDVCVAINRSSLGYFSQNDYKLYIERAVENNWLCPAHAHLRKQSYLRQIGHITGIAPIPFKPSDFLPVRDRSSYPDGCAKTPPTF